MVHQMSQDHPVGVGQCGYVAGIAHTNTVYRWAGRIWQQGGSTSDGTETEVSISQSTESTNSCLLFYSNGSGPHRDGYDLSRTGLGTTGKGRKMAPQTRNEVLRATDPDAKGGREEVALMY